MASARESVPVVSFKFLRMPRWGKLGIVAAFLGLLFGFAAFWMLVWHDHGHANVMVHDQHAQAVSSSKPPLAMPAPAVQAAPITPVASPAGPVPGNGKNEFSLTKTDKDIPMESLRLKLLKTDMAKGLYDVSVISGGRSYYHRRLKVTQPLWIATSRGSGSIELVVDTIGKDSVAGYWKESDHSAQVSARARGRRR